MIVDAIVKTKYLDKNSKRVEVYSPKYASGIPLLNLSKEYEGRQVKLITGWEDINIVEPVTINGSIIDPRLVGNCSLSRGMVLGCFGDDTVYVVMPERFIK